MVPEAGIPDAAVVPAPIVDAGPASLAGASVRALWDGGELELTGAPDASVSPWATFRFETSAPLADYRVRILDDQDHLQPNHARLSSPDGGALAVLEPSQPLPSRQCCRFVVDGERGPLPTDAAGHLYQPLERRFSVWALPQLTRPGKSHRHRRHRR